MKLRFSDLYYEDMYEGRPLKGKPRFSEQIIRSCNKKIEILKQTARSPDLYKLKSLHFKELDGDKQGIYSIRLNDQYRLEFRLENEEVTLIEIITVDRISKHYE